MTPPPHPNKKKVRHQHMCTGKIKICYSASLKICNNVACPNEYFINSFSCLGHFSKNSLSLFLSQLPNTMLFPSPNSHIDKSSPPRQLIPPPRLCVYTTRYSPHQLCRFPFSSLITLLFYYI